MSELNCSAPKVTVFTPAYNRAYILPELYHSLRNQTCFDFEWIIVDDGSADGTEALVGAWLQQQNAFAIRYYKQKNGGKHRAINCGAEKAAGELFFIVDSDDQLTADAVESLLRVKNTLPDHEKFAGVAGNRGYHRGGVIGTTFDGDMLDCSAIERRKYGIDGDKAEAFFTSVLKKYPFPEYEGENFVTEAVVWDKMALDGYKLRYFNKIIYLCDYLEDGLTNQGLDLYYRNPQGYGHYLRQCRKADKFGDALQRYFDVECYLHWRRQMSLAEIAALIGAEPIPLLLATGTYQLRLTASRCKRQLLGYIKGKM